MPDFPDDFLWGSGTAAHQVEGGNVNSDWWAWEQDPASGTVEPSGDAIDQWNRYADDFALLAALGQNAHRFSLEWSRIEPAPGQYSQAALDHYARVLDTLADLGLTAFATLYHFTLPQWFAQRGGWLAPDALDLFGRYVEKVANTLGNRIPYACTVNEPQIVALTAYLRGEAPPGHQDVGEALQCNQVLAAAHRTATAALRAGQGAPKIGTCLQLPPVEPADPESEADVARAGFLRQFLVDTHLDDLRAGGDVGDFVGLQYYSRLRIDAAKPARFELAEETPETNQLGWETYPEGFGRMLRELAGAGLPVVVTENGIATSDDRKRVRFLAAHLAELKRALEDGVDVRGYLHWSSFDNFEWHNGYAPTFGLIGIDRANSLRRVVRPSAALYGEVARTGSLAPLTAAAG